MPRLIGVSGLCGVGKTTAVKILQALTGGREVYLGGLVLEEVRRRGLPGTPESERIVQLELRQRHGAAALASLAEPTVAKYLTSGADVVIDAIFTLDEFNLLKGCASCEPILISIHAPFELRRQRLVARKDRPYTEAQLRARDENEVVRLATGTPIALADYHVVNDRSLHAFEQRITHIWSPFA